MLCRSAALRIAARAAPARVGCTLAEVGTPALLIDFEALESNVSAMQDAVGAQGGRVRLRPHAKAFKSAGMMHWLSTAHGISRVCAQTPAECEAMVAGGCGDVLLTNQCVTGPKLGRVAALAAGGARVGVCVDNLANVEQLAAAARQAGAALDVYLEINGGQNRCGVLAGSPEAVQIAAAVRAAGPALHFAGIQCYHGGVQHVREPSQRRAAVLEGPVASARVAVDQLAEAGIECAQVSGGGTGTYPYEIEGGVHTELQPGSFLFMDLDYGSNKLGPRAWPFAQSLYVHATVISADEAAGRRVVDAGAKAVDLVTSLPRLAAPFSGSLAAALASGEVRYTAGHDEHGLISGAPPGTLPVGSTVQLIPGHCDPTVNLHTHFVCMHGGQCEYVWEIDARGPGW